MHSLAEPELGRALSATISVLTNELERSDPALATRLLPMLADLAISGSRHPSLTHPDDRNAA